MVTKRCPGCEAVFAEGTFCELCGEKLSEVAPEHTGMTGPPTMPVALPPLDITLGPSPLAEPLSRVRERMSVGQALDTVRAILELARRFERDGLAWQPQPEDFCVEPSGEIVLAQARAVGKLGAQPFDVRRVLWAAREVLLPHPLVGAGADAIRFVSERVELRSVKDALARLDEIVRRSSALSQSPERRVATACDIGLLRDRNEDAVRALEGACALGAYAALVVCDGVSSSSHGEIASRVGADAALAELEARAAALREVGELSRAVSSAVARAHEAIVATPIMDEGRDPSGTTIVVALVCAGKIAIGWAGDSRAYLLAGADGELLTRDHSWLNHAVDSGILREAAEREPLAHALTRCIGPLEIVEGGAIHPPDVRVIDAPERAVLVLCSDGLWVYFPTAEALAEAIAKRAGASAAVLSQVLVDHALARGGQDNVAVAVCRV